MQVVDALRGHDLAPFDPILKFDAVGAVHDEIPHSAGAELKRVRRSGESVRTPPPGQMRDVRECLEHEAPWTLDGARHDDFAIRSRLTAMRGCHQNSPSAEVLVGPRGAGRGFRSRTARTRRPIRGLA